MSKAQSVSFLLSQVRASGIALAGGSAEFFEAGTSTPKTIWLDRDKANPAVNPYELDSNGTAQLFADGVYRVVIKDSTGAEKYDRDGLSFKDGSSFAYDVADYASLAAAIASIGSTPATLQFAADVTISANLVIPFTLELMPLNGAKINHNTYTISYAGNTDRWPLAQVFNGTGAVTGLSGVVRPEWFGADNSGVTDSYSALASAITSLTSNGGTILGSGTYLLNSGNLLVNQNNTNFDGCNFNRTIATGGWMLRFATTVDTSGGGVRNCTFTFDPSLNAATGGVAFGSSSDPYKANGFVAENITTNGLSQYGVGIWNGDNWKVANINVLNHGSTHASVPAPIGIGFFVYPYSASSGGQVSNVYAEINAASTITNSAAVKLQTHQKLTAINITSVGGTEESMAIDSVDGLISNVSIIPSGSNTGLSLGNYNPTAHSFSGQTFTLVNVTIKGTSQFGLVIAAGTDGFPQLKGCTLRGFKGVSARYLARSAMQDCLLENWDFQSIQFDSAALSYAVNSVASNGNVYRNLVVRGDTQSGYLQLEASKSAILQCGASPINGDTVAAVEINGNYNTVVSPFSYNSSTNALTVAGAFNEIINAKIVNPVGRSIWFKAGSHDNNITSDTLRAGTGPLDNGYNNWMFGRRKLVHGLAAPTTGVWAQGDRCENYGGTVGQPKGWTCTTAGGAKSTTRADATAYAVGVYALWATGTSVWQCTTAGTTGVGAPDITGKVVGNTVTDGTVVWTMMSTTTAAFTSEGNL